MNEKIEKNKVTTEIKLIFNFKKDAKTGFREIQNDLQNLGFAPIGTKRAILDNCLILCYNLRVRMLPFKQYHTYNDFNQKYSKILNEISIKEDLNIELEWTKDEINEIPKSHLDKLLMSFLKNMDSIQLETLLTHVMLFTDDFCLGLEEINDFHLNDNIESLGKLFNKNEKKISKKNIKQIFQCIDTNDFILLKQLFFLIRNRDNTIPLKKIFELYSETKGKEPFPKSLLRYVYTDDLAPVIAKLEIFFKKYIHLNLILQDVRDQAKINPVDIRIELPFETKAYNFEKAYPSNTANILKDIFQRRGLVLNIFKYVLHQELRRANIDYDGLLISFTYDTKENYQESLKLEDYYFDDLKVMYDDKLEEFRRASKDGDINKYVILNCFYITNRNKIDFDWSRQFKVRDNNHRNIDCKIIQNRTYFNNLPLEMENELEIQGILKVKYKISKTNSRRIIEKYIEVIDIKIIDNFKVIKYHIGTRYHEESFFENTREGLSKFTYSKKEGRTELLCQTKILAYPMILINQYSGQNDTFYEIKVNGDLVCKPKEQIIDFLDENNYIIHESLVKSAISQIIRESIKEFNLKQKPMYNSIGIHLSKKNELELVYEDNEKMRVIGENDVQADLIEKVKEMELDKTGDLTQHFFKIAHLPTIPKNVRLSLLGYSASEPFFYALRKKLNLFPYLFIIGKHGSGKTTILKLFINTLFGTIMKTTDDVDSKARITKFLTESPFCLNIDDIDTLAEELQGFLKSFATRKGMRHRMDKQKMNREQMYSSIVGTANSNEFITSTQDEALRIRCIIHNIPTSIKTHENKTLLKVFQKHHDIIEESNLVYGYYLLEKSLEFLEKSDDKNTKYLTLSGLINKYSDKIMEITEKEKLDICDVRRYTLYSLMYIGWLFWDYTFKTRGLKSELLEDAIKMKDTFLNYIQELEKAERDINLELIDNIMEFFRQNIDLYEGKRSISKNPELNDVIVLRSEFITHYDKFARLRGYPLLKSLKKLGDIQSKILNREITPTTIRYQDKILHEKTQGYGLHFFYKEILSLRTNEKIAEQIFNQELSYLKSDNPDSLTKTMNNIEKSKLLLNRMNEIFESNNNLFINKKDLIQVLSVEENLTQSFIEKAIKKLIENETLIEKGDQINFRKNIN